jgi:hypothetical protein
MYQRPIALQERKDICSWGKQQFFFKTFIFKTMTLSILCLYNSNITYTHEKMELRIKAIAPRRPLVLE